MGPLLGQTGRKTGPNHLFDHPRWSGHKLGKPVLQFAPMLAPFWPLPCRPRARASWRRPRAIPRGWKPQSGGGFGGDDVSLESNFEPHSPFFSYAPVGKLQE